MCQFILVVYKRLSVHLPSIFLAPCILLSGILEQSYGVEFWSGVGSNFGVECITDAHSSSKHAKNMKYMFEINALSWCQFKKDQSRY